MEYVKVKPSAFFRVTSGMTDAECGRFMRETMAAVDDDRHGVNSWADALLDEVEAFISIKREAGRRGGQAKARNAKSLAQPSTPLAMPSNAIHSSKPIAKPSKAIAQPSTPLAHPTQNITEQNTKPIHPNPIRAHAREAGEKPPQAAIPNSAAPARPVGAAKAANPPQHPPQPAPPPETPPAARNAVDGKPSGSGGGSRTGNGSGQPTPSGKAKSPFSWAELAEDKQRYVWTIPDASLPAFAVWFCQEEDNARALAVYGKYIKKFGANPFRILLDKFVASVFAGEEPDNRGAAFMATVMAEGRGRQAELAKTGNKPNQTNKQNNQNKGENK